MAGLRRLLEIDVRHGFYADAACPALRLAPTLATRALMARSGAVARPTARGLELWLDDQAGAGWHEDADALTWSAQLGDPAVADCTADLGRPREQLSYFDADAAVLDTPTGYWRLHALDVASTRDLRPLASARADAGLAPADLRGNPCALIRIPTRRLAAGADDCTHFLVRLAARATVWKYCFVGAWSEPALQVVDLAQRVRFEPAPPHALADGRTALAFRSSEALALQELPHERFQLRSSPNEGRDDARTRADKVIVKRLPAAAPRHFSREVIDGVPALVSEIFVHR